jgi:hypothetical protein
MIGSPNPDIEDELVEGASGELSGHVESDRGELVTIAAIVGPHGGKREEVVERELLRSGYVVYRRGLVVVATEVDVLGRASGEAEAKVQRECAFEYPTVWGYCDQSPQEQLECNSFAQPGQRQPRSFGFVFQPLIQRLSKRGGIRVFHCAASTGWTARRTSCLRRLFASASSWRSVTSPRLSAWLTAIVACSGWISATTSTSVRAGVVSGRPSRQTVAIASPSEWV